MSTEIHVEMKKIKLTQNKYALVDDLDFKWLNQWKWTYGKGYAYRKKDSKTTYMHRLINNTPEGFETDHINRNKLDNRRENLRTVTNSQNKLNTNLQKNNKSGYRGIWWESNRQKYKVQIRIHNRTIELGRYFDLNYAILARKWGELIYWRNN